MKLWALSDPHLAFGVPNKSMEAFGEKWKDYPERIERQWRAVVAEEDIVLVPGDISWGLRLEEALVDLEWLGRLPGTKIILRGNHDYWWPSAKKLKEILPPSIRFIQNNALLLGDVAIGGSRLWDTSEYSFNDVIHFQENPRAKAKVPQEEKAEEDERIFKRELERLRLSLSAMDSKAKLRIALTHYPPIGKALDPSRASAILEEFKIDICVFGHLHNVKEGALPFGQARGVRYIFSSADYLDFAPLEIVEI
jgi:hypothetical protein